MITKDRLQHMLAVARKAQALAEKIRPGDKEYAQDMFLLGLLHDLGYEFTNDPMQHATIGANILKRARYKYWKAVAQHGDEKATLSDELLILNKADMGTGPKGETLTVQKRLADIKKRYGEHSPAYQKAKALIQKITSASGK
ncbi:MAG: HD domain-containing protein [Alphaproteobacteria bacterium]|nr:HD domain-containing protein [Alphaproteobacteria bacterium]